MKKEIEYRQMEQKTETIMICDYCGREVQDEIRLVEEPRVIAESPTGRRRVELTPDSRRRPLTRDVSVDFKHDGVYHLHRECIGRAFEI